jgi:hypothetical protein
MDAAEFNFINGELFLSAGLRHRHLKKIKEKLESWQIFCELKILL